MYLRQKPQYQKGDNLNSNHNCRLQTGVSAQAFHICFHSLNIRFRGQVLICTLHSGQAFLCARFCCHGYIS